MKQSQGQHYRSVLPESLALFEENSSLGPALGTLNDDSMVRAVVTESIKQSNLSREEIGERMTAFLGLKVSARMITAFTSESKELHRWPGAWDRAFCKAVGDDTLLKCRAEAAGYQLIKGDEVLLLELGRQYLRRKRANEEAEMLERRIGGVDL